MPAANLVPPSGASLAQLQGLIVLVGGGKMGGALLQGWLRLGLDPARVVVLDPEPSGTVAQFVQNGVRINPDTGTLGPASTLILAVKPQVAGSVLPGLKALAGPQTLVLSIMAGKTLAFLDAGLPGAAAVRAMPNTPAAIGRGITVAVANSHTSPAQRDAAERLLGAVGAVEWVDDEGLLDAVTAVSGSGPAYVFLLAESLARAGVAAGLPAALAAKLARLTVSGSGELLHQSGLEPAQLRANVTSPAGTTAAALSVLMADPGLHGLIEQAVGAATRRSRELGS